MMTKTKEVKQMEVTMKAARVNAGLTQKEAGMRLGVSRYTIGSWERGETFPTMKQVKEIEKIYHIPYDQIIFCP